MEMQRLEAPLYLAKFLEWISFTGSVPVGHIYNKRGWN